MSTVAVIHHYRKEKKSRLHDSTANNCQNGLERQGTSCNCSMTSLQEPCVQLVADSLVQRIQSLQKFRFLMEFSVLSVQTVNINFTVTFSLIP